MADTLKPAIKEAVRPIIRGCVDPWTKDDFALWVDGVADSIAEAAIVAMNAARTIDDAPDAWDDVMIDALRDEIQTCLDRLPDYAREVNLKPLEVRGIEYAWSYVLGSIDDRKEAAALSSQPTQDGEAMRSDFRLIREKCAEGADYADIAAICDAALSPKEPDNAD
jgi:hypothetical protein